MKKINHIAFSNLESIPKLIKDFLDKKWDFFSDEVFNIENIQKKIQQKQNSYPIRKRILLTEVLKEQHSHLKLTKKQTQNLELVSKENTFTVVTGHQLNLYTGSAFFIYKILQTIKTTEFLKIEFPDHNFIPLFWLASEDHDFLEINHFKTQKNYFEINAKQGGAVGRIVVDDQNFFAEFEEEFKDSIYGTELILWLKEAYKKGHTLADAIKILVNRIFGEYGLLMLDGDSKALKSEMIPIFEDELKHQSLKNSTKTMVDFLKKEYGSVQVNPRDVNLFYLTETRNRIDFKNGNYNILDTQNSFSEEEMLNILKLNPEKISPNALMRPVYQEFILPNLAYIGGNAEIMYWLELQDYFKKINLEFPVLIPRNSIVNINQKQIQKSEKLNLDLEDFYKNFAEIINQQLLKNHVLDKSLNDAKKQLQKQFTQLKIQAELTDKSFKNLVEAEETRQLKSFKKMRKRLLKAEKIKQKEKIDRLEQLFLEIHPGKIWQERVYNFSVYYADNGRNWLEIIYEAIDVNKSELILMQV